MNKEGHAICSYIILIFMNTTCICNMSLLLKPVQYSSHDDKYAFTESISAFKV